MIIVDGSPLTLTSSTSSSPPQGIDILNSLMGHPAVLSSSSKFKNIPERKITDLGDSASEMPMQPKYVYLFQREYATVDPAMVEFVGTDEATTCVAVVIRNRRSRMTSLAHMDSPNVVEIGLMQMLSLVVNNGLHDELDVHLVGGFQDAAANIFDQAHTTGKSDKPDGYSLPLCAKILDSLWKRRESFHIQTMFVLGHNTIRDAEGNTYPMFNGVMVESLTGSIFPASFCRNSRCPDETVRRIRLTACNDDPSCKEKLLETYDTLTDKIVIAPCCWSRHELLIALTYNSLSDPEILFSCSTSPLAEGPDFVDSIRRKWDYLIKHPDWRETFPGKQPRVFARTTEGGWTRC